MTTSDSNLSTADSSSIVTRVGFNHQLGKAAKTAKHFLQKCRIFYSNFIGFVKRTYYCGYLIRRTIRGTRLLQRMVISYYNPQWRPHGSKITVHPGHILGTLWSWPPYDDMSAVDGQHWSPPSSLSSSLHNTGGLLPWTPPASTLALHISQSGLCLTLYDGQAFSAVSSHQLELKVWKVMCKMESIYSHKLLSSSCYLNLV